MSGFVVDIGGGGSDAFQSQQPQQQQQQYGGDFFPSAFEAEAGAAASASGPQMMMTGGGGFFTSTPAEAAGQTPDTEPPLLEELEISLPHIWAKTKAVLNPLQLRRTSSAESADDFAAAAGDGDLAGPLLYCLLFGVALLLAGKLRFGVVFGLGALAVCAMWALLNLMSERGAAVGAVASALGYCMLPILALAAACAVLPARLVAVRAALAAVAVAWAASSASLMLVRALAMVDQRLLVAYPASMVYACFALLTLF